MARYKKKVPLWVLNIQASQKKWDHLWLYTQVLILWLILGAVSCGMKRRFAIKYGDQVFKYVCASQNSCSIVSIHVIVWVVSRIFFYNLQILLLNVVWHVSVLHLPLEDLSNEANLIWEGSEYGRKGIDEMALFIEIDVHMLVPEPLHKWRV